MSREKHPIHLGAKKAGQLNKVMLAIMKEEMGPLTKSRWTATSYSAPARPDSMTGPASTSLRLLSRYGLFLGAAEGDYEGAQQALGRAIAIASRGGLRPLISE